MIAMRKKSLIGQAHARSGLKPEARSVHLRHLLRVKARDFYYPREKHSFISDGARGETANGP